MAAQRTLYVISDLHIGGTYGADPGAEGRAFRMNSRVPLLAEFVRTLAARPAPVELVVNGDFVDFLAEKTLGGSEWRPFLQDQHEARDVFRAIARRDADLFAALGELLAAGHDLTILLGNHDLELCYPAVRRELEHLLGVRTARGHFRFLYDGEAYVVGDLLIEHGNRYDGYNVVDHDGLRRLRSTHSRGVKLDEDFDFRVPPGSQLVASVMNPLKAVYPFIDLIKPENEAAIPLLLALAPGARRHLWAIASLNREAEKHDPGPDHEPRWGGDVASTAADDEDGDAPRFGSDVAAGDPTDRELAAMLETVLPGRAADFVQRIRDAADEPGADDGEVRVKPRKRDYKSWLRLGIGRERTPLVERMDALADALAALRTDTTWNRGVEQGCYLDSAVKRFESGFRCVVYGHTHLPRRVEVAGGVYLNTGTWTDVMRFPLELLEPTPAGRERLRAYCQRLKDGLLPDDVEPVASYARITLEAGAHPDDDRVASAELCDYPRDPP